MKQWQNFFPEKGTEADAHPGYVQHFAVMILARLFFCCTLV